MSYLNNPPNPTTMSEKSKEAIKQSLLEDGFTPNEHGVFIVHQVGGNSFNLTSIVEHAAAQERAAAVKEALEGQWVKCSERLPAVGQYCLVWVNLIQAKPSIAIYERANEIVPVNFFNHPYRSFITHWMPLPQPPKTESE